MASGDWALDDFLQRSEQYLMASQFLAQDLRHVIFKPQHAHILLGKCALLPLNVVCLITWL